MALDYTVVMHQIVHVGDEPEEFGPANFVGPSFDSKPFSCPKLNTRERAVLQFQSRDVDSARNIFRINGHNIFGGVPVSANEAAVSPIWNGNIALIEAGHLKEHGNILHIEARDKNGAFNDVDDFLIDNVVVFFKTTS